MKTETELIVIQRFYDYLLWISPLLNRLPRDRKFTIGDRLLNRLYDILEDLIRAKYARHEKGELLERVNTGLEIVRFYQRMLYADKLWDKKRLEYAAKSVNEIGRMLGSWLVHVKGRNETRW
jgi:hypothetical protein